MLADSALLGVVVVVVVFDPSPLPAPASHLSRFPQSSMGKVEVGAIEGHVILPLGWTVPVTKDESYGVRIVRSSWRQQQIHVAYLHLL